ncbi:MAG: RNA polymerase sigma factor (sigma-70 family) [Candidatus Azotimanducaceae bacterium]|jgi:RNA polymerase sigma factor (sigma-70 family)
MQISTSQTCPRQLAAAIQAGNPQAEEEFCGQYRDVAIAALRPLTGDAALIEDIAHDALLIVLLRLRGNGIRHPERLHSYVKQTAKFALISWYRRKDNQAREPIDDLELAADQVKLEDGLIREQSGDIVRTLIKDMKAPRDRQILARSYIIGEEKAALCDTFNLPRAHFDRVISRARLRLREAVFRQKKDVLLALQVA